MLRDDKQIFSLMEKARDLVANQTTENTSTFTTSTAKTRRSFFSLGALAQKTALDFIARQSPLRITAVLIKILETLLRRITSQASAPLETIQFVRTILEKIMDLDTKQNFNLAQLFPYLWRLNKKAITDQLQPVITALPTISIAKEDVILWFEAILWLEGLFLHEHFKALKKGNGELIFSADPDVVAPVDRYDETLYAGRSIPFFEGAGITKHFILSTLHAVAVLLEEKLKNKFRLTFATHDVFPTRFVREAHAAHQARLIAEKPYTKGAFRCAFASVFFDKFAVPLEILEEISDRADRQTGGRVAQVNRASAAGARLMLFSKPDVSDAWIPEKRGIYPGML